MDSLILVVDIHSVGWGRVSHESGRVHARGAGSLWVGSLLGRAVLCQTGSARVLTGRELFTSPLHTVLYSKMEKIWKTRILKESYEVIAHN